MRNYDKAKLCINIEPYSLESDVSLACLTLESKFYRPTFNFINSILIKSQCMLVEQTSQVEMQSQL
jgi:hypothetical protein